MMASKQNTSTASSSDTGDGRAKWDNRPRRNPPGALRGVRPVTQEPWGSIQDEDIKSRLDYGHEDEYEHQDGVNSFVVEAARRREENTAAKTWNAGVVRHAPPVLRGQSTRRPEPWSSYHNDTISELNSVDDTSVNEFYAITADRDNRVKPTVVQPTWDDSKKFGAPSMKPGTQGFIRNATQLQYNQQRAAAFRAARKPANPAGGDAPKAGKSKSKSQR